MSGGTGLSKLQRAVAMQGLYNAIGAEVRAGGDGLRGDVDRELREIYERTGAKSYRVQSPGGANIGTYSVVEAKAVPAHVDTVPTVTDGAALDAWLDADEGRDMAQWFAASRRDEFAAWCVGQGVVPGGVELREVEVPAKPAGYKCGQVRVDRDFQARVTEMVMDALPALVSATAPALGEGA